MGFYVRASSVTHNISFPVVSNKKATQQVYRPQAASISTQLNLHLYPKMEHSVLSLETNCRGRTQLYAETRDLTHPLGCKPILVPRPLLTEPSYGSQQEILGQD